MSTRQLLRFATLQALIVWQGGFVFYSAVVVPIGSDQLGSLEQGLVTRRVTLWLNALGAVSTVLCFAAARVAADRRLWSRCSLWATMALVAAQFVIHGRLSELITPGADRVISEFSKFRGYHIAYLWCATLTWVAGLTLTAAVLFPPGDEPKSPSTPTSTPSPSPSQPRP